MLKNKLGQIWISAVLYIAIGIVAITIILSAGVPLVNKIKDKNTILQTKEILLYIDNTIREVRNEGPGSRRVIDPFIIKDGDLFFNTSSKAQGNENKIQWDLKTSTIFAEPCGKSINNCDDELIIKEGTLKIYQTTTIIEDEYVVHLELDYSNLGFLNIKTDTGKNSPLKGKYSITIENAGINSARNPQASLPDLDVSVV